MRKLPAFLLLVVFHFFLGTTALRPDFGTPWKRLRSERQVDEERYIFARVPEKQNQVKDKSYQPCKAPGNRPGHCKHLSRCRDEVFRSRIPDMINYMCIIEKEFVGVCCPDNTNIENGVLPVRGLAGSLPAIATEGDDALLMPDSGTDNRNLRRSRACGLSKNPEEYPWVAAILVDDGFDRPWCGGVLITDRHVLTAAHCVHEYYIKNPSGVSVRLGEYDLRYSNETRALEFKVIDIRIHKKYVATTYRHDIAILKIHRPTAFNTYIWPICLPPPGATFQNKQATVVGWGTMGYAAAASDVLMEVSVPIWPQHLCMTKFIQEITPDQICAAAYEGNGDACQFDSGGPLMHQLSNGRWITVGIVSWGIGCGEPGRPGIYTRVNSYLDWIFANTIF